MDCSDYLTSEDIRLIIRNIYIGLSIGKCKSDGRSTRGIKGIDTNRDYREQGRHRWCMMNTPGCGLIYYRCTCKSCHCRPYALSDQERKDLEQWLYIDSSVNVKIVKSHIYSKINPYSIAGKEQCDRCDLPSIIDISNTHNPSASSSNKVKFCLMCSYDV